MTNNGAAAARDEIFAHARGYFVSKAIVAMWRLGLLDDLRRDGELRLDDVVDRYGYVRELVQSLLDYVTVRGYLEKLDAGRYVFSEAGRDAIDYLDYLPHLVGAYEPVFGRFEDVVRGELEYGRDVRRSEHELAIAVGALWRNVFGGLASLFSEIPFRKVLDMGSGSGQVLSQILELAPQAQGIGVDIDGDACAEARRRLAGRGLSGRSQIVQGDAAALDRLPADVVDGVDLVTAMFVMHEILRQRDRDATVDCLRAVRSLLGDDGRFVMVEVSKLDARDGVAGLFVPEYQLAHDFSNQRLTSRADWEAMLAEAGLEPVDSAAAGICQAFCLVVRPVPARARSEAPAVAGRRS